MPEPGEPSQAGPVPIEPASVMPGVGLGVDPAGDQTDVAKTNRPMPSTVSESVVGAAPSLSPEVLGAVPKITAELVGSPAFWNSPHDEAVSRVRVAFPGVPEGDINAIAFVVLMEASKSADSDLRQIMEDTKAETAAKQRLAKDLAGARAAMDTADPTTTDP